MNWKIASVLTLVAAGALVGIVAVKRERFHPPVNVTLRISVAPAEQLGFVVDQAGSARLKYEVGKKAGLKPGLAQRLVIKAVPNSPLVEVQGGTLTKEEGLRFIEAFIEALQAHCGKRAELTLTQQSIR